MKILVTGVTSFVGYHLAAGFREAGFAVTGTLSRPGTPEGIRGERAARLARLGVAVVPLDLKDPDSIARSVERIHPDLWVQHAGYTKAYAYDDYDLHAGFTLNVSPLGKIFAAMSAVNGAVIVTGTVSEYSDSDAPHLESECCVPATPYGLSKLMETLYARQLALRYGVPTRIARLFLPFGPLDSQEKLLPSLIASLRQGRRIALSPCLQRRDFIYVDDVVSLYVRLVRDLPRSSFEVYNVCSGESPALRDVIEEFVAVLKADPALCDFGAVAMRPGEPPMMRGSNKKARQYLHWSPMSWQKAIRRFCKVELEISP